MTTPPDAPEGPLPVGPRQLFVFGAVLILVDIVVQYLGSIYPWDPGNQGWRVSAVQVAVTQVLPIGMALFLLGLAAGGQEEKPLRRIQIACWVLSLACVLATWYVATAGAWFSLRSLPAFFPTLRRGVLQALSGGAIGALGFGLTALLLRRVIPRSNAPA